MSYSLKDTALSLVSSVSCLLHTYVTIKSGGNGSELGNIPLNLKPSPSVAVTISSTISVGRAEKVLFK